MLLLVNLINNNETLLLDILRDQYSTEEDKKGGSNDNYQKAVNLEIPQSCLNKAIGHEV